MFDPTRLLTQMLGGTLGGALGGKGSRKHRGSGLGGMLGGSVNKAALGVGALGIAMAAWEHYKGQPGAAQGAPTPPQPAHAGPLPPPPPPAALPSPAQPSQPIPEALLAIRSMIAAAAADGLIDGNEREAILERARAAGMDADDQAALRAELAQPLSLPELIAQTPAQFAAEVYVAALITISVDSDAERRWMDRLAQGLNLSSAQRSELDAQFSPSLPL